MDAVNSGVDIVVDSVDFLAFIIRHDAALLAIATGVGIVAYHWITHRRRDVPLDS